jgi:hypothetical protein
VRLASGGIAARVVERTFLGSRALVRLELAGGGELLSERPADEAGLSVGSPVTVAIEPSAAVVLAPSPV